MTSLDQKANLQAHMDKMPAGVAQLAWDWTYTELLETLYKNNTHFASTEYMCTFAGTAKRKEVYL